MTLALPDQPSYVVPLAVTDIHPSPSLPSSHVSTASTKASKYFQLELAATWMVFKLQEAILPYWMAILGASSKNIVDSSL
tara:strand:+ start:261 stop:500 length:240 start_codon:yes stop_codon:yes gene_type:complete